MLKPAPFSGSTKKLAAKRISQGLFYLPYLPNKVLKHVLSDFRHRHFHQIKLWSCKKTLLTCSPFQIWMQQVKHWQNANKVKEYERGSNEFCKLVAASKYKDFVETLQGYILVQGYGDFISGIYKSEIYLPGSSLESVHTM